VCNNGVVQHNPIPGCCAHSYCAVSTTGVALPPLDIAACTFDQIPPCLGPICNGTGGMMDPYCCMQGWDAACVSHITGMTPGGTAPLYCTAPTGNAYKCNCAHSYCQEGVGLDPECDPCSYAIAQQHPECISKWTLDCVSYTHTICHVPLGAECQ
jgi:hypothetical protein